MIRVKTERKMAGKCTWDADFVDEGEGGRQRRKNAVGSNGVGQGGAGCCRRACGDDCGGKGKNEEARRWHGCCGRSRCAAACVSSAPHAGRTIMPGEQLYRENNYAGRARAAGQLPPAK